MSRPPRLYHVLQLAARRLHTVADRRGLEVARITAAQAGALFVIADSPGTTQRAIAAALGQKESAITAMVSRLLAAGFVAREPSLDDGRAWSLFLTPSGEKALTSIRRELDHLNDTLLTLLGRARLDALARDLRTIAEAELSGR